MKVFRVSGINRLSASNLISHSGLTKDVDYSMELDNMTNIYTIYRNKKTSSVFGAMSMLED